MGIEPTHRLLGGAQDLKSWEGTSPQPLPQNPENLSTPKSLRPLPSQKSCELAAVKGLSHFARQS